ncbi:hypothetical protein [Taylorella equigenitalis]|uniref:Fic family protein n=1 Tax=Taylorella equigenitalis (strain MCE9) TaxID=937774 RepID=A0A654KHG9_TAYEM|nr:hypothetical protein [Taylorella equigenitalis]ADU91852.1 Fic family protein [Taylorella equigenitalis MCE9]ASY40370.1 cell filamentation protein Fic [Taylorella equigenitalis]WDU46669.1 cell filamentation protein Fic [Taylorella equigenitalis]WDU48153.1 cell filamentation protein Fic [Taylorella equigenitalis]WDU52138.1 cell filamentation protein Fic [Taylorella equigenitalis]
METPNISQLNTQERRDLFNFFRIATTHHSNAIEGLSMTFGETKQLLSKGETAPNKPLKDNLIILGFAEAFDSAFN